MKDTIWIYPGSFDPVTYGHIDIIGRAAKLCGKLEVAVMENYEKTSLFSLDERVKMLREVVKGLDNVVITSFSGLQADFYREEKADAVVRGIRNNQDFDYEVSLENGIKLLVPEYEVVYLATEPRLSSVNSSFVRALGSYGGDVSAFVPENVEKRLKEKFKEKY